MTFPPPPPPNSPQSAASNSLSTQTRESKSCTSGDGPAVREDGERGELGGREDTLNLVWKGVGSLSERLAEVDTFFEKLEQDMDHDREVTTKQLGGEGVLLGIAYIQHLNSIVCLRVGIEQYLE